MYVAYAQSNLLSRPIRCQSDSPGPAHLPTTSSENVTVVMFFAICLQLFFFCLFTVCDFSFVSSFSMCAFSPQFIFFCLFSQTTQSSNQNKNKSQVADACAKETTTVPPLIIIIVIIIVIIIIMDFF